MNVTNVSVLYSNQTNSPKTNRHVHPNKQTHQHTNEQTNKQTNQSHSFEKKEKNPL